LGELGDRRAIPDLQAALETKIWDLQYAADMALEKLGEPRCFEGGVLQNLDWLMQAKVNSRSDSSLVACKL
jgi:bilin biosynthesis protein